MYNLSTRNVFFRWIIRALCLCSIALLYPLCDLYAATQGTLGAVSTGSITISVTKQARARISDLSDLTLSSWTDNDGDVLLTDDVCVYSTRPSGGYTIKATGSGTSGAFSLSNGVTVIPYNVLWNAGGVNGLSNSGISLASNVTSAGFNKAATDSSTCNGTIPGPTARLMVNIPKTSMTAAADGSYAGTLTLLVTPN